MICLEGGRSSDLNGNRCRRFAWSGSVKLGREVTIGHRYGGVLRNWADISEMNLSILARYYVQKIAVTVHWCKMKERFDFINIMFRYIFSTCCSCFLFSCL